MTQTPEKKILRAWYLYDWANSAFVTSLMAALLPIYFREVAAAPAQPRYLATSLWGYTAAFSMLLTTIVALLLGPVADYASRKKRFLAVFTGIGVAASLLLACTGYGDWIWVALLYLLGTAGFAGSEIFYDSLLPHICRPDRIDQVSTRGYAAGYVGGGLVLALNIGLIMLLPTRQLPDGLYAPVTGMKISFLIVGLWWALFSIPLFRRVPEPPGVQAGLQGRSPFRVARSRLFETFREIRRYRELFVFIIAFWFYNDGIGTIIKMATAYGSEIGISYLDLIGALLLTQIIGVPCSLLFGRLAGQVGARNGILTGLAVYTLISVGGFFMRSALHFWILAGMVGCVQGGTQALSRSLFGSMVPGDRSAEFFGFYTISGKFSGIAGPALFALAGQLFGTSRFGILSLVFFFVAGGIILLTVNVERGIEAARFLTRDHLPKDNS
ncbi:MAG TPA: MFS transporter [bacterium]|nr:MFS transporter [bacterium]